MIRRLFNIIREDGLASWFAVSQTLVVAMFFSYLCIDDGAMVHERLGSAFKETTGPTGLVTYAWHYLPLPFFAGMGVVILAFLWWEMPAASARLLILAALGCFGLAVGKDFVEGMDGGYRAVVHVTDWEPATIRHFSKSLEETLEMLGMSLFLQRLSGIWPPSCRDCRSGLSLPAIPPEGRAQAIIG